MKPVQILLRHLHCGHHVRDAILFNKDLHLSAQRIGDTVEHSSANQNNAAHRIFPLTR